MRCKRCGNEMKIKAVEVGKDAQGNPIYNDYAFCYECKIKINLDKKREKEKKIREERKVEPTEDLSLTRQFEIPMDAIDFNDDYVREYIEQQKEKKVVKKAPDSQEKKLEKKKPEPKTASKQKTEKKPERPTRSTRESQRDYDRKFKEMPEKRVKEVRKKTKTSKKRGKGIIKFLVAILIIAGIGAAAYFNQDTIKGWIHWGLEKFDSVSDGEDKKQEDKKTDIVDDIDAADDNTDTPDTDASNAAEPDNAGGADAQGSQDANGTTDSQTPADTTGTTE